MRADRQSAIVLPVSKIPEKLNSEGRAWWESLSDEQRTWVEEDQALRRRAGELARKLGRDEEGLYKTLVHFRRSASERLRLGLRCARLRAVARRV